MAVAKVFFCELGNLADWCVYSCQPSRAASPAAPENNKEPPTPQSLMRRYGTYEINRAGYGSTSRV